MIMIHKTIREVVHLIKTNNVQHIHVIHKDMMEIQICMLIEAVKDQCKEVHHCTIDNEKITFEKDFDYNLLVRQTNNSNLF